MPILYTSAYAMIATSLKWCQNLAQAEAHNYLLTIY